MNHNIEESITPFGTILGYAPGNVPAYSSDYKTVDITELTDRHAYRQYVGDIYTGYKWQCVEFARRWLLINKGYIFDDIAMAYDIFRLTEVTHPTTKTSLPLHSFENGSQRHPTPGCMLIWSEGGDFSITGHVAIVTEVTDHYIRVAEQNVSHALWEDGQDYARELSVQVDEEGGYWIQCSFSNGAILGWVIQTENPEYAAEHPELDTTLLQTKLRTVTPEENLRKNWLNIANPDEAAYVKMNGHTLCAKPEDQNKYFCISATAENELKRATNELHALFMHATDYVLQNEKLLHDFNIPENIWPKIQQSWSNRKNEMVTGRFDFCITEQGIKAYEYNADSASCHMECGKIQGLWAKHMDCNSGRDAGQLLYGSLIDAWKTHDIKDVIHLLIDNDDEEELYHCYFMKEIIEKSGGQCEIIKDFHSLKKQGDQILDIHGTPIKYVWKTWAWETALDQLREELDEQSNDSSSENVKLKDILFQPETLVFEPLWTLIPSNKAILPLLWKMFPNHPYLLESAWECKPSLQKKGYAVKPIVGRCGANISLVDDQQNVMTATAGQFTSKQIYQERAMLPCVDGLYVQLCTFSANGAYAGACTRVDASPIITYQSELFPLRIIEDESF